MTDEILPFDRVPRCACDSGRGDPPTKLQMLECRLRRGSCAEPNKAEGHADEQPAVSAANGAPHV